MNNYLKLVKGVILFACILSSSVKAQDFKIYYQNGQPILYSTKNDVFVSIALSSTKMYGKYYTLELMIENRGKEAFHFDPNSIVALIEKKDKGKMIRPLSYEEYISKVGRKQNWQSIANSFVESVNASGAGYTSSSSSATVVSSNGYASGYANYVEKDGFKQYAANQIANAKIEEYNKSLMNIRSSLSTDYMKTNTVFPNTYIAGYINIPFKKGDKLSVSVPVKGENMIFVWAN